MDVKTKLYLKQYTKEILGRPWLFPDHGKNVPVLGYGDYLEWFRRNYSIDFVTLVIPGYFEISMIDKYKDNVYFTSALFSAQGGRPTVTTLQFSKCEHALVSYIFDDDNKLRLQVEYSTNTPSNIPKFYDEIKQYSAIEFEDVPQQSGFGFNGAFSQHINGGGHKR